MQKPIKPNFIEMNIFNVFLFLEQVGGRKLFKIFNPLKNFLLKSMCLRLSRGQHAGKKEVERKENLSASDFQQHYFNKSIPVIFSGAAKDWECCKKWDLDYFKFGYGEENLLIVNANGLTSRSKDSHYEFLTVSELIENIKNGGDKYLRFSPLLENNPDLVKDLNMEWLQEMRGQKTFANTYYMFIGGKGKKTLLHTDQPCNIYVQVYGEKKWTLYFPKDTSLIYPQIGTSAYIKSPVDVDAPDDEKFPLFKYAEAYEVHLKPGDVLYVPPHTWHFVENLSDSIAVGYRFSSLRAALKSSIMLSVLRIVSVNPPVWKTMEYGKIDTNLIWAHSSGKIKQLLEEYKVKKKRL